VDPVLSASRILACEGRLQVLRAVGADGRTVTEVAEMVGLSVSTTSVHLARLARARLVVRTRVGRRSIYRWTRVRWTLVRHREDEAVAILPHKSGERHTTA